MKVDEKEFFREATLRICGSLDVETFLWESFVYIRTVVPAESVFLTYYDRDRGEHVALAKASGSGGSLLKLKIRVPKDLRLFVERPDIQAFAVKRADMHPTARPWISRGLLKKDASLLVVRLIVKEETVGAVIFHAQGSDVFTDQHARLLSSLREPFSIALSNGVRYQELSRLKELLAEDNRFLRDELREAVGDQVVGAGFGLRGVMEMVRHVARMASPVLLLGETGTGKEVIAQAIHNLSSRKDGPFIKVNCGAIPESLMDSELFGHEKGAFTGAISRKRGRFERANSGTIFLDEVGELRPEVQVRLLRVLQEKEIERVGGTDVIRVDIRVIAATHRDLEDMVQQGRLRDDLYFRLRVFPIEIPPLRERKGDIPSLVQHFIQKKTREMGLTRSPGLAPGALDRLMAYAWPGNVRELENTVERGLILSKGAPLVFRDLHSLLKPRFPKRGQAEIQQSEGIHPEEILALDDMVANHIRRALDVTAGRVGGKGGAADRLKINPSTLRKRMRKLGIPFGRKAMKKPVGG